MCKFNSILLQNQKANNQIQREIIKYSETNKHVKMHGNSHLEVKCPQ